MLDWIASRPDRLDSFLTSEKAFISRMRAQAAIGRGEVKVNDTVVDTPAFRLQEGDRVTYVAVEAPVSDATTILPADLHLRVLYEDDACLVIEKPAGTAVHPGAGMADGEKTLLHGIAALFAERGLPFRSEAVLVHRLDRETTGCILAAKTPEAHLALQRQFEKRTVTKIYLAVVTGIPSPASAVIDAPIGRSTVDRTKMAVHGGAASRTAKTTYRTLSTADGVALLSCELHTGRTHQIRVHLFSINHPILGDDTYSSSLAERLTQEYDVQDLLLHAWKLSFVSPADGDNHSITCDPPTSFLAMLQHMKLSIPA